MRYLLFLLIIYCCILFTVHSQAITVERRLIEALHEMTSQSIKDSDVEVITEDCKKIITRTMLKDSAYLIKFFRDSAHSLYDLGSYYDCTYKSYYYNEYTHSDIIKKSTEGILNELNYVLFFGINISNNFRGTIFGACLPKGCEGRKDYVYFIKNFYMMLGLTDISNLNEAESEVLNPYSELPVKFFYGLPAVILLVILMVFSCFPKFPVFLFKCCFRKKTHTGNDSKQSSSILDEDYSKITSTTVTLSSKYNERKISMFKECWKLKENLRALNVSDSNLHESSINNDGGFSVIKGIRGVILILYLFSHTFKALCMNYYKGEFETFYFNTPLNSILFFFIRFSMSACIALSAFTLAFKLVSYLEKETRRIEKMEDTDKENDKKIVGESLLPGESTENNNDELVIDNVLSDLFQLSDKYRKEISILALVKFISRQFYKYLLYLITMVISIYSYYDIISYLFNHGALWEFMKKFLIDLVNFKHILGHVFLYYPFLYNSSFHSNPFGLVILEISYFIFGSILIFICYKRNWRIDIILLVFFILVLVSKLAYAITAKIMNSSKDMPKSFFPAKDFTQMDWNFLRNNQLYNGDSFSIGIFFGLVNYAIQNNIPPSNKIFTWPLQFLAYIQRKQLMKLIVFTSVFILLFIWNSLSFCVLFKIYKFILGTDTNLNNEIKAFSQMLIMSIYYFYDIDVLLIIFFITIIAWLVKGQSGVIKFLQNDNWNFFSRSYYTFILIICGLINTILLQTDNKVKVSPSFIAFYSLINSMFGFIFCAFGYVFFELPLKRFNKFLLTGRKEGVKRVTYSNSKIYD